jgi:2-polyprenyl-3-methyl-5-hydroxy-6-metoxy-1,4-benzoquinol methylase
MPLLSNIARQKKIDFFIKPIPKNAVILEVGCGNNWLGNYLLNNGWKNYTSIDLEGTPTIKGNINSWKLLGLKPDQFDVIIAFEVVEHDDIWEACYSLLKPEGNLLITTPYPAGDWVLRILEFLSLNQKRTSRHTHLQKIKKIKNFKTVNYKKILSLSQWAIFKK